jgi:hypothetical protein
MGKVIPVHDEDGATKLDVSAQIEGDSIAVSQQGGRSAIRSGGGARQ